MIGVCSDCHFKVISRFGFPLQCDDCRKIRRRTGKLHFHVFVYFFRKYIFLSSTVLKFWYIESTCKAASCGVSVRYDYYNTFYHYTSFVYCRELAPGTVSLTAGWVRGDDSEQNTYYNLNNDRKRSTNK